MANLRVSSSPLVPRTQPHPAGPGNAPDTIRAAKRGAPPSLQAALEASATAFQLIGSSLTSLHDAMRQNKPTIDKIRVTDNTGRVIAAIGPFEYGGIITPNYFSEIHVGDPLNTGNPAQALFNAANGRVTIGQNGVIEVLDPFGADAAWIGAQADTLPVTGAGDNGGGLIQLTVAAHTLVTGDTATVLNVGGVPNATGIWTVTSVDASHVVLQNSVFVGAYTGGGTINRVLHVSGAANNGTGLIRLTITAHGFETGDKVNVAAVSGVPAATGQWIITVITVDTFDLQGSAFGGGYGGGGVVLRYFGGMLAQTFAIGPTFGKYKLRAFADGSLKIKDATVTLNLNGITTSIANVSVGIVGVVGVEVQDNVSLDAGLVSATFITLFNGDPTALKAATSIARNGAAGIVKAFDGSGAGGIDTHGLQCVMDGSNGNITAAGDFNTTGGVYRKAGAAGISAVNRFMVTGVSTAANAVFGAPAAGQANGTVVTGVSLTASIVAGGIITS